MRLHQLLLTKHKVQGPGRKRKRKKRKAGGWVWLQDRSGAKKHMGLGNVTCLQPHLPEDLTAGSSPPMRMLCRTLANSIWELRSMQHGQRWEGERAGTLSLFSELTLPYGFSA